MRLRLMAMRARKVAFAFVEGQIAGTNLVPPVSPAVSRALSRTW